MSWLYNVYMKIRFWFLVYEKWKYFWHIIRGSFKKLLSHTHRRNKTVFRIFIIAPFDTSSLGPMFLKHCNPITKRGSIQFPQTFLHDANEKGVKHKGDGDTNSILFIRNNSQQLGKKTGGNGGQKKVWGHRLESS